MLDRFGPWSSALGDGMSPHLDTFWKRRLSLLASTRTARFEPTRRDGLLLGMLAIAAFGLPTLHLASAQSPNLAKSPGPGRIYVRANFNTGQTTDPAQNGLFAIDPGTATRTKLLDDFGFSIRVSPDGRTVALSRAGWTGGDREVEGAGLWTIESEGKGEKRKIANFGGTLSWSPDSRQIMVSKSSPKNKKLSEGWSHETWRMNADGSGATKLTIADTEEIDDWSPDGRLLVSVSDRQQPKGSGYQLYVMRPDGTEQHLISSGTGLNVYPRFSPDGLQVAYLHQERGVDSLWVVNVDGSGRRMIVPERDNVAPGKFCWSPDGKSIVYRVQTWEPAGDGKKIISSGEKSKPGLVLVDSDGKNPRPIQFPPARWVESPDWR